MEEAVLGRAASTDVIVMAAAVADFRPKEIAEARSRRATGSPRSSWSPPMISWSTWAAQKRPGQPIVGFAAETADVRDNAIGKLRRKSLDLIVANDVSAPGVGFEHDTNAVTIFGADGSETTIPLTGKREVASAIIDAVVRTRRSRQS